MSKSDGPTEARRRANELLGLKEVEYISARDKERKDAVCARALQADEAHRVRRSGSELIIDEGATDKHSPIASARSKTSRSGSDAGCRGR
jgi:hypothetical protein